MLKAHYSATETKRHVYEPRVREEGYFHSGSSGLTIQITERQTDTRVPQLYHPSGMTGAPDKIIGSAYDFRLRFRHGAHGAYSMSDIPLTPEMCVYLIGALQRAHARMTTLDGPSAYRDAPHSHHDNHRLAATPFEPRQDPGDHVRVIEGCKREEVYAPTIVTSEYGTARLSLGFNHVNPITGDVERYEPRPAGSTKGGGGGACGGPPEFWPDEIGLPVFVVAQLRKEKGRGRPTERDPNVEVNGSGRAIELFVDAFNNVSGTFRPAPGVKDVRELWSNGPVDWRDDMAHVPLTEDEMARMSAGMRKPG